MIRYSNRCINFSKPVNVALYTIQNKHLLVTKFKVELQLYKAANDFFISANVQARSDNTVKTRLHSN